mgnify:FL=1
MKDEWINSILKLTPAERVRIAQLIWESIEEIPESSELSEPQRLELARRLAEFEKNGSQGRPWRDVLSEIGSDS